jgi:hypothetical protein
VEVRTCLNKARISSLKCWLRRLRDSTIGTNIEYTLQVAGFLSFLIGLLTREDGTDTLSRNVGKQLPHDAA